MKRHPTSRVATTFGTLTRSELMSRVASKGNKTTEGRMIQLLRSSRITGWRRHVKLPGNPDFVWRKERVVLFVDGCFWHGHNCGRNLTPRNNAELWENKISATRRRDAANGQELQKRGWSILRIWECELKKTPDACLERLCSALGGNGVMSVTNRHTSSRPR